MWRNKSETRENTAVFWSPYANDGSSVAQKAEPVLVTYVVNSNSSAADFDNRHARFMALQEAIRGMSLLPLGHQFFLHQAAADKASDFLGFVAENLDIDAPKLFSQDGEAAVFTWDRGVLKQLVTVDEDDDFDIMDINTTTFMRCHHEISNDANRYSSVMRELRAKTSSMSVPMEGDV